MLASAADWPEHMKFRPTEAQARNWADIQAGLDNARISRELSPRHDEEDEEERSH